jgi:hypothetical protein
MQAASFSRSWPPRSCVDTSEPNRFTGSPKEFCELNSGAWIRTVDRFPAQQSAAPDGKASTVQTVRRPTTNQTAVNWVIGTD